MKKLNIMMVGISLVLIVLLGIGVSYSLWNISVSQDKVNTAMTSCFDITYSSESNAINLEKQYPISDESGSKLTPYTFKITNNCDINAYYKINLETLNTSNIDIRFIKASLNNTNPQVINRYNETEVSLKNGKVANTLKSGYLPVGGSISFDLRVWLDYDTTINDIKNDGTDKWIGKIVVVSSPVTEDEINKACQSNGGDLIDGGECRKYYVKVNNFIENSNFADGIKGWSSNASADFISYKDNLLSMKCSTTNCGYYQKPIYFSNYENYYYMSFNIKTNSLTKTYNVGYENIWHPVWRTSLNNLEWNFYSYKFLYDSDVKVNIENHHSAFVIYTNNEFDTDFYIKNINYIDLTLMFGSGNEPNKKWCDKYLDRYIEYNLDGTMIPIKEIGEPVKTSYYDKIDMFD